MEQPLGIKLDRSLYGVTNEILVLKYKRAKEIKLGSSPVCHDQELAEAKEEELHEPGQEVAQSGDGVLLDHIGPPVGPREAPPVELEQLGYYDDEEDELDQVGDQAGRGHDLVKDGLELVQLRPRS